MDKYIDENIYVFAARYAHSRNTGAAYQVVVSIIYNWGGLSRHTQIQLKNEAKEAVYNKEDWDRLDLLEVSKNQCDGCISGMELVGGLHLHNGKPSMACTKHLYK